MLNDQNILLQKLNTHSRLSWVVIGLGLLLLIYMVTVEDEPGALPLALIVGGTVWNRVTHRRRNALLK